MEKRCKSSVTKGESHSINERNGSLEARKESEPANNYSFKAWSESSQRQMDFYLTQVIHDHEAFNMYLFRIRLVESLKCANCDGRGRGDSAFHSLFECPTMQLYWENVMTTLQEMSEQPLTLDSFVPVISRSTKGWNQVAAFVALTMHHKMELAREQQRRWTVVTWHPTPTCFLLATQQWTKKTFQAGQPQHQLHMATNN